MALRFVNNPAITGLVPPLHLLGKLEGPVSPRGCDSSQLPFAAFGCPGSQTGPWGVNWTGTASLCPTVPLPSTATAFGFSKEIPFPTSPEAHPAPPAPVGATAHLCSWLLSYTCSFYLLDLPSSPGPALRGNQKMTAQCRKVPAGLWRQTGASLLPPGRWQAMVPAPGTAGVLLFHLGYRVRDGRGAKSPCRDVGKTAGAIDGSRTQTEIPGDW